MADLLDMLRTLEVELHQGATRADRARMDTLLHPQFVEFGRSGAVWTREATLAEFFSDANNTIKADIKYEA